MDVKQDRVELTGSVKQVARQFGAALVGVASVDRFAPMPPMYDTCIKGMHPKDFIPEALSVVSIAMPILDPVMDAPARLAEQKSDMIPDNIRYPYYEVLYHISGHHVQDVQLQIIGQMIGQFLMTQGYQAMIFPTSGMHPLKEGGVEERKLWEGPSPFGHTLGPFSHRHAATRAGLGEFGLNNLVLTPEFGPRQRFNSVITDAPLDADPLISKPICLRDKCGLCLKACHVPNCITFRDDPNVRDYRSVEKDDHSRIFIDTPTKTDPKLCGRRKEIEGQWPVRGDCVRACPIPRMRKHLPERLTGIVKGHKGGA
jgi:epoxyqueuosine reductase QueG